ncbi:MAG: hypothetical protein R3F53_20055 [Gammaproteobacteria bacterium]
MNELLSGFMTALAPVNLAYCLPALPWEILSAFCRVLALSPRSPFCCR